MRDISAVAENAKYQRIDGVPLPGNILAFGDCAVRERVFVIGVRNLSPARRR